MGWVRPPVGPRCRLCLSSNMYVHAICQNVEGKDLFTCFWGPFLVGARQLESLNFVIMFYVDACACACDSLPLWCLYLCLCLLMPMPMRTLFRMAPTVQKILWSSFKRKFFLPCSSKSQPAVSSFFFLNLIEEPAHNFWCGRKERKGKEGLDRFILFWLFFPAGLRFYRKNFPVAKIFTGDIFCYFFLFLKIAEAEMPGSLFK